MVKPISIRYATEDDYKKLNFYNVGTLHRASTSKATEASSGEGKKEKPTPEQESQPKEQ